MPFYKYRVINKNFERESGTTEAANEHQVEATLVSKGYQVIAIEKTLSLEALKYTFRKVFNRVTSRDLVVFFRQFSVLISASINLSEALRILADQTEKPLFKNILVEISNDVDAGVRLSDALTRQKPLFNEFHISVIRSGETSGRLDEALLYLADEEEKTFEMMRKVKGAMIYPALVISAMMVVGVLMMLFVVPKLISIFNEVGGQLPLMTRILIGTSNFFVNYWYILLVLFIAVVFGLKFYLAKPIGKKQFDYLALRVPVLGKIIRLASIIRFCRSMSTLIVGGVTITNSLRIAKGIVGNEVYREIINQTIIEVEEGNSISTVFLHSKDIPVMVPRMMIVGERTGKLDFVLDKIAVFYGKELDAILDNLMVLLEPIIMIVMGIAVGLMATAIIMPMYNLTSQM
ncbi:MAG: type II secretion system F family protein [Candidatus Falkowbacteria bacterium]